MTVAKEVELEDPVENVGAKLVRQAAQKTNDQAGDGTTTATVLSAAMITEVGHGAACALSANCLDVTGPQCRWQWQLLGRGALAPRTRWRRNVALRTHFASASNPELR